MRTGFIPGPRFRACVPPIEWASMRKQQRQRRASEQVARDAAQDHLAQARVAISAKREHPGATPVSRFDQRLRIRHVTALDGNYGRRKAMPGEMVGDIGSRFGTVALGRRLRIEDEYIDPCPRRREHGRVAQRVRRLAGRIPADRQVIDGGRFIPTFLHL